MKTPKSNCTAKMLITICGLCVIAAFSARATVTTVTWDLNPSLANGAVGSASQVFTSQGFSITAAGFDHTGSSNDPSHELFFKNGGADETGLGLVNTAHNELQVAGDGSPANYIQLDLHSILAAGFTNGKIEVGSVQSGESFVLYGSNKLGTLGAQIGGIFDSNSDNLFVSVPNFGSFKFLSIAAASADVLPVAFQADINPVPEVNTFFPIVGLLAAVLSNQVLRRRRMAQLGASHKIMS
jgi:hypothetical protein